MYAFFCYQYRNTTGPLEDLDESSALLQCYMILFRLFRNILFRKQRQSTTTTPTSHASLPREKAQKHVKVSIDSLGSLERLGGNVFHVVTKTRRQLRA